MVNRIQKGKRFERQVATYLSKLTGSKWQRVPQSGATATCSNLHQKSFYGDVFSEEYTDLVIECKNMSITISDLMNYQGKIWKWITKLESNDTKWLLFINNTCKGTYIIRKNDSMLDFLIPKIKTKWITIFGIYEMIKIR